MKIRNIVAALIVGVLALSSARADDKKDIKIGMVAKSQSNAVFQAAYAGAKAAAKELGPKYNANITIDWQTPADEDAQKQAQAIEALTGAGVQGIAVSCSEARTLTPAIDKAVRRGIPVICFDSDAPKSKRFAYYGTDDIACGTRVMDELAKAMGEKGTIAILGGNQSAPNLQKRVQAVKDDAEEVPEHEAAGSRRRRVLPPGNARESGAKPLQSAQNANPQIEGWALIGGWPLFTANALPWPAGKIKVVSVDALPAQLPYLRDGHVAAAARPGLLRLGHTSRCRSCSTRSSTTRIRPTFA